MPHSAAPGNVGQRTVLCLLSGMNRRAYTLRLALASELAGTVPQLEASASLSVDR